MLLTFTLNDWEYALDISLIDKTYRAATVTPLPECPEVIQGIINIRGVVFPVINLHRRFSLPEKELSPDAHFIVADAAKRSVVLLVDQLGSVIECDEDEITVAEDILPALGHVEGVLRLKDGMVVIQDLGKLLSLDEEAALTKAMEAL